MEGFYWRVRSLVPIGRGRRCPACSEETMRERFPWLLGVLAALPAERVQYRWCRRCRWRGVAWVRPARRREVGAPADAAG
jgi:hypothetical protein